MGMRRVWAAVVSLILLVVCCELRQVSQCMPRLIESMRLGMQLVPTWSLLMTVQETCAKATKGVMTVAHFPTTPMIQDE